MNILMAGESAVKRKGIEQAFRKQFPNEEINVISSVAPSGINEQPVGQEEAVKGVNNQERAAIQYAKDNNIKYEYLVTIESYIEAPNQDIAYVRISYNLGEQLFRAFCLTESMYMNTDVVDVQELFESLDYTTTTLSEALSKYIPDLDAKDPHLYFTGRSRSEYICDAILN